MNTESIVYMARRLHWTRDEIGKLTPAQFNEILRELTFQDSVDTYRGLHSVASIIAAIYNTIPRRRGSKTYKAIDFLTAEMPQRNVKADTLESMAKQHDITLPSKELQERA